MCTVLMVDNGVIDECIVTSVFRYINCTIVDVENSLTHSLYSELACLKRSPFNKAPFNKAPFNKTSFNKTSSS